VREKARHVATSAVLAITAEQFAVQISEHQAAIAKLHEKILGFGRIAASPDTVPAAVRALFGFGAPLHNIVGPPELAVSWRDAADVLKTDPMALVEIGDPPPPAPRPSMSHPVPHVAAALAQQAKARAEQAQSETPPEAAE
jgi:hypothetical protein